MGASHQASWLPPADAWRRSPTMSSSRCRARTSGPAGSATCGVDAGGAAQGRWSRWCSASARSTTRRCTISWRPRRGTGGRCAAGWLSGWSRRWRRRRGWWTTPASPRTTTTRWGCSASTAARWARRPTASWGVSVNAVTEEASCPLDWRLFLPRAGTPMSSGARPATCPSGCGTGRSVSWCWTCWMSWISGGFGRRCWSATLATARWASSGRAG
jgi:hypothetical protein